jgi:hypothetical protein
MQRASALRTLLIIVPAALLLAASPVAGQQTYVSRFDAYAGYAFLDSPHVSLFENGFQMQVGVRPKPWYSLGFDYSISAGNLVITPDLLPTALQQQLSAQLAQLAAAKLLPAGYVLAVPAHSRTQTFAVGPQLAYRHFSHLTLFIRPSLGAIHEVATPHPGDPIATAIAAQLAPAGKKTDWTGFYGFGGGFDILLSKHFAVRTQADLVYDHLFNDLLKDGRFTVRFSIGPCFNFGKNIAK